MRGKRDKYIEHLSRIPMFEAFSKKELMLLARLAEDVNVDSGSMLIKEGATGREFFVVAKGKARIMKGKKKIASVGPGAAFGELSLLDGAPRSATIVAETPMEVIVLGQREFLGLLYDVPNLAFKLLKAMARRLREADERDIKKVH